MNACVLPAKRLIPTQVTLSTEMIDRLQEEAARRRIASRSELIRQLIEEAFDKDEDGKS